MAGVFRRPFRRAQRRKIVHGVGAVVVQAPGLHRRRQPMAVRRVFRVRQTVAFVVGGVGRTVPVLPIARMLMERRGKILRERLARKPVTLSTPVPVVVGATPFLTRPVVRPVVARVTPRRVVVPTPPAVVGSVPFPARPVIRVVVARVTPKRVVVRTLFIPAGSVPFPARPVIRPLVGRVTPKRIVVPTLFVPAGSVPFPARPVSRPLVGRVIPKRIVVPTLFVPPIPIVAFVSVRRPRSQVKVFIIPPRLTHLQTAVGLVTVCTSGTWSAVISFLPCDDYRLELDGPAADQVKASVNMEFEE